MGESKENYAQQSFVEGRARELFVEEFGKEATDADVCDIFVEVLKNFEEEANEDESEDEDYDPEEDSFDYAVDAEDDNESECAESESELSFESCSESGSAAEKESGFEYDLSERDSYDPEEDSYAYTMSIGTSESDSKASIESYNPSDDSFDYTVALATSASESTTESEYDSYDKASSDESDE